MAAAAAHVRAALGIEPTETALSARLAGQPAEDEVAVVTATVRRALPGRLGTRLDDENLFAPPAGLWWNRAHSATPGSPSATLPA